MNNNNNLSSKIILIGPMGTGKSTIGKLISETLSIPQYSIDKYRLNYYNEIGYNAEKSNKIMENSGLHEAYKYWKPFEAYAVERFISEYKDKDGVLDFGAGLSVYEDLNLFNRVKKALSSFENIILLLPSSDIEESINTLNKRRSLEGVGAELNAHFVKHNSNYELAKHIVYTKNKTPIETHLEVIELCNPK